MKKLAIKARLLMGDGGCTTEFVKNAGEAAEGHYCSLPGIPYEKMPGGAKFIERFGKRFADKDGKPAGIQLYAPYAYDAVMVVVDAVKRAGGAESAKILAELPKTNYQGVTTTISFDEKGDIKDGAISLYVAKGGKWEALDTIGGPAPAVAAPAAVAVPAAAATTAAAPAAAPAAPAPAAAAPAAPAAALAKSKNCLSCHAVDKKMVGPSYQDVAKKYAGNAAAAKELAAKVRAGGKGVWGQIPMPPNPGVSEQEADALVAWVLAGAK